MTVCIAAAFLWNYAKAGEQPDHGVAVLTASDRMLTAFDVEYEPSQQKVGRLSPRTIVMVAGDLTFHSPLITATARQFQSDQAASAENIATIYGRHLQTRRQRLLEDLYLAPLGLNTDTFHAQQKDLSDSFVARITDQLQTHKGPEAEALIIGSSTDRAEIWGVDEWGSITFYNDVGFAAIGLGASHAKSSLMQAGYVSGVTLAPALAAVFAAKKSAEVAPGVSESTDWHIVLKDAYFRVWPETIAKAEQLYKDYKMARDELVRKAVTELQEFLTPQRQEGSTADAAKERASGGAQTDGSPSAPTPEAPRADEAKPPEKEGGQ